jgi:hypothetical protein
LRAAIRKCQPSPGIVEIEAKAQAAEGREYRAHHIQHPTVHLTEPVLQVIGLTLRGLEEGIAESALHGRMGCLAGDLPFQILKLFWNSFPFQNKSIVPEKVPNYRTPFPFRQYPDPGLV